MCKGTIIERRCKCRNPCCPAAGREPDEEGHSLGVQDVCVYNWCKHYLRTTRFNYNAVHPNCRFTAYDVQQRWAKELCEQCKDCPQDGVARVAEADSESGSHGVVPIILVEGRMISSAEVEKPSSTTTTKRPVLTRGRDVWSSPEFKHESTLDMVRSLASNWNVLLARRGGHLA